MTRPVERWALLRAKIIFVGAAFGALPLLLHAAVLLRFGLESDWWGYAAIESVVPWAATLAGALAMASVTKTMAEFFVGSVLAYLAPQLIGVLLVWWSDAWTFYFEIRSDQRMTAIFLGAGLALAVFSRQVLVRQAPFPRSVMAAAVAGYALIHLAPLGSWMQPAEPTAPYEVRFDLGGRMPDGSHAVDRPSSGQLAMWTRLQAEPMPAERSLELHALNGKIECGGSVAEFSSQGGIGPPLEARQLERGARWARNPHRHHGNAALVLRATPEVLSAMFDRPCNVSARVDARFLRQRRLGSLALRYGSEIQQGSYRALVEHVDRTFRSVTVTLTMRGIALDLLPRRLPLVALVRPSSNEWVIPEPINSSQRTALSIVPGPTVRTKETELSIRLADLDEGWIDGAELVLLEQIPDGRVQQRFTTSDVRLQDTTDGAFRAGGR